MDAERQIIAINCVPSCHQQGSPLPYACSNTSNNSTSNPSYYSPNATDVNDSQDLHVTSTPCNTSMQDLSGLPVMNNLLVPSVNQSLDVQKRMIKEHPLYPLLAVLFRQCESGTVRPCSPPALDLFNEELRVFIDRTTTSLIASQSQQRSQSPHPSPSAFPLTHLPTTSSEIGNEPKDRNEESNGDVPLNVFMADPELNELIFLAVKVLRIHLQELHKVNELSKDFCSRYITSLKTKFQSDLLRFQDSEPSSPAGSEDTSPFTTTSYPTRFSSGPGEYSRYNLGGILAYNGASDSGGRGGSGNGGDEGDTYTPGPPFADTVCSESSETGAYTTNYINDLKMNGSAGFVPPGGGGGGTYFPNRVIGPLNGLDVGTNASRTKRGVLPKRATQVMKQWLFQHLVHPYPTEDEKRQIASQTNLTLLQVNNWFINARRRILQPMLETTGPYTSVGRSASGDGVAGWGTHKSKNGDQPLVNKKKKAATTRPSNNRFWPASLAAAAALLPNAAGVISGATLNRNAETTLVWTKSHSTPSNSLSAAVRTANLHETSPGGSGGEGDSSPSSLKSRPRKLPLVEPKDMRHDGVYADFAVGRFPPYVYHPEGGVTSTMKPEASYDSRALSTASTYQSFLQHAFLQHQHHPPNSDIKPSHSLPPPPQNYTNWSHFLEDRHTAQHPDYGVSGPPSTAVQQYTRPEEGLYFSGQASSWSYNVTASQPVSTTSLTGGGGSSGGGGISTDIRCVQADTTWPPVNSGSYPASSFPVETERSIL
ncbi:homeobox protein homothorax [Echinococcus multilocularis]|uniref:Homeobox protein pknox n=1 Tax=Echinococcus multilocularis TaxID=6211 RepID=A0A068Y5E9_ECHMU|nr:homeobox protein homothorax [Echinococcus multilocularis]